MGTHQHKLSQAVEHVLDAGSTDTTEALCRLAAAQQVFDQEAAALHARLSTIPTPTAPPAAPAVRSPVEDSIDSAIPDRLLQLFWLLLVAGMAIAFSVGFWLGRGS